MVRTIAVLALYLFATTTFGQDNLPTYETKKKSFYFEFFGQGLYNSFSFDKLCKTEGKVKTSYTTGLTIIPHPELFVVAIPVSYNYIIGHHNHHLELGFGFTPMYIRHGNIDAHYGSTDVNGNHISQDFIGHQSEFYSFFTPKLGYRFQKEMGGLFLRLGFTPPIAGINRIGKLKGGTFDSGEVETEYFSSAAFFDTRIFPWAGMSIGFTLKK